MNGEGAVEAGLAEEGLSLDAFLGGKVRVIQPRAGHHRSGLEAVLLGCALPEDFAGRAADLGAGAGVAGLCLAARAPAVRVTLIEREPDLAALARRSAGLPANRLLSLRVDIYAHDALGDLDLPQMDAVLMNPPFHAVEAATAPKAGARARAHMLDAGGLDAWFRAAVGLLRPAGVLIGIFRADALPEILAGAARRFGALDLLPVHPRPGEPAHRLLLRAVKGRRSRPELLPGLTLHGAAGNGDDGAVEALLRQGAGLESAVPAWGHARGGRRVVA